jgi:hypothetical protein
MVAVCELFSKEVLVEPGFSHRGKDIILQYILPKILGTTTDCLVTMVSWHTGLVKPWFSLGTLLIICLYWCDE